METLRRKEVAKLLGVNPSTVDLWRAKGIFPRPIMLGDIPVWLKEEIVAWMESRRGPK